MLKEIRLGDRLVSYDLQRKKVKNINIRIKRDLSVHVSAAPRVPQADIERILKEKSDFILSAIEKYESLAADAGKSLPDPNSIYVFGQKMPVVTVCAKKNGAILEGGQITLMLKDISDSAQREKVLGAALDSLLKSTVEEICREIQPKFVKSCPRFPNLKFRHMKSRWGSCNYKDQTLTFNYSLIHARRECIEFVIYHEFTHFIHPNHSPDFYRELSRYIPDHKKLKKELENYKEI